MRNIRFIYPVIPLVAVILALPACRNEEKLQEFESTLEAQARSDLLPKTTPVSEESLTEEPTEEVTAAMEPEATETPAAPTPEMSEMEEFISATEFFAVKVPEAWTAEEVFPGGAFIMANSAAALERHRAGASVEPGDLVLNIGFLPYALLEQKELKPLDIQFRAAPDVFLESLLPLFNPTSDAVLSEAEVVSLSDDREAGMLTLADDGREGMILMYSAGDGVLAFVSTAGFPGETSDFRDITYAVASEVSFSGAQEALYGRLLGG